MLPEPRPLPSRQSLNWEAPPSLPRSTLEHFRELARQGALPALQDELAALGAWLPASPAFAQLQSLALDFDDEGLVQILGHWLEARESTA